MARSIRVLDTTLRDGAQMERISFSVKDKLRIARKLDSLGVHYIEGGWPGSNPKDAAFFAEARNLDLKQARLAAFGCTRRAGTEASKDRSIVALLEADTSTVVIVGKSSDVHVRYVLGTTMEENLSMIEDSIAWLKAAGREVIFDAEHFFDGYRSDATYAMATVRTAWEAGADCIVLCDTNGGALPWEVSRATGRVHDEFPQLSLGIHAHDDSGVAVANTLVAIEAGASHVQGTINGYGERCGNANLCAVIPTLQIKMGLDVIPPERISSLTEVSRYVSEVANLKPYPHWPYVGRSAFTHKAGLHVNAISKMVKSYEHVDPDLVGNQRRVLVSELAGAGNIQYKIEELPLKMELSTAQARDLVLHIKEMESKGFQFEGAEGSLELLLCRSQPGYSAPFEVLDFIVLVEKRKGGEILAEATVKARVDGVIMHTAAEGNGPVNALDKAMRKALLQFYPRLVDVQLTDFKVRILDEQAATEAQTRVLIDASDGENSWSTVGCSANIIEASFQALIDSLEFPLMRYRLHEESALSQQVCAHTEACR